MIGLLEVEVDELGDSILKIQDEIRSPDEHRNGGKIGYEAIATSSLLEHLRQGPGVWHPNSWSLSKA